MNIKEKLDFFSNMIQCNHNLPLHSYKPELILARSDIPQDASISDDDTLVLLSLQEPIKKHLQNKKREPLFIDDHLGLIWIVAFEYEGNTLQGIHTLGPAYSGRNSYQNIKKELDKRDLSVSNRIKVFKLFDHIPIIPTNQLFQYAVMLHYCVTGMRITTNDLHFSENASGKPSSSEINLITEEHRGIWIAEQEFMNMLREGNPNYLDALAHSRSLSDGPRFDTGDSLRRAKSTSIVLLTLCSRAAIEGGVNPSVAYTLNDYYMQMIEDCKNIAETSTVCSTLMEDYVQRVQQEKAKKDISGQIRSVCDYIAIHIKEKLAIPQLAKQAGYTEYYFSHKFKNEVGCSVADYIKREKIRRAKLLLAGTNMSIQEISDELSFGSRSYFSSSFQKETGLSPSEYREQNIKL
ncbi:MAG: AraC family transcriptional regulator [Lachnospiraceae bacterium]|nr:AraC family transcriptional regulator [Lachnospiraceae bacterium]